MIALRRLKKLSPLASSGIRGLSSTQPGEALKVEGVEKPVWSWNEWDPLKEVIVGKVDGIRVPRLEPCIKVWGWLTINIIIIITIIIIIIITIIIIIVIINGQRVILCE